MMQEKLKERTAHLKKKKRNVTILPIILIAIGILVSLFFYLRLQKDAIEAENLTAQQVEPSGQTNKAPTATIDSQQEYNLLPDNAISQDSSALPIQSATDGIEQQQTETLPLSPAKRIEHNAAALTGEDYERAVTDIHSFYTHLDQQPYIKTFQFSAPTGIYFSQLIQKILDTPPIVSGETNDLFSILQNTAHFFRVVGRENIIAMKTIITHEKGSCEDVLNDYYTLTHQPEYLQSAFSIQLQEDALYDYAGFFLTTMGGRLYLFRQDSMLRMVVSYYSVLIVDKANRSGKNRHGIDIRPVVENLIYEIENSGNQLQLKEHYLDTLYDLKERNY